MCCSTFSSVGVQAFSLVLFWQTATQVQPDQYYHCSQRVHVRVLRLYVCLSAGTFLSVCVGKHRYSRKVIDTSQPIPIRVVHIKNDKGKYLVKHVFLSLFFFLKKVFRGENVMVFSSITRWFLLVLLRSFFLECYRRFFFVFVGLKLLTQYLNIRIFCDFK